MTMMLFIFLCFAGFGVMFFYMMRSQEKFQESMRAEHAQMRLMLRSIEARLAGDHPAQTLSAPASPPESLSLERPHALPVNNGLELHFDPQERH